jgi:hypothetical protein
MNSSGIKRGLATTAVSALAIAGLPFLASSASAANPDMQVLSKTGVRNDGDRGGELRLKVRNLNDLDNDGVRDAGEDPDEAKFIVRGENPANDANAQPLVQTVAFTDVEVIPSGSTNDSNKTDGYDEVVILVDAQTQQVGGTAKFSVVYTGADADYDLGDSFVATSVTTVGAPARITVTPNPATAAKDQAVTFTARLTDANGDPTQLLIGQTANLSSNTSQVDFDTSDLLVQATDALTAVELADGSAEFTVAGRTQVTHTITADIPTGTDGTAVLDILKAATVTNDEVDIVSGADNWNGFGDNTFGGGTLIRVDQSSFTVNIDSDDPADFGGTVVVKATGNNGITFEGKPSKDFTVTLNGDGVASFTVTPDAGTIADGRTLTLSGFPGATTLTYEIAEVSAATANASTYISSYTGTVSPVITVRDQFGNPVSGAWVDVQRLGGANADATPSARKQTGADGTVTFDLVSNSASATDSLKDDLQVQVFANQFSADADAIFDADLADIVYTADGRGNEFILRGDNIVLAGAAYDPASVFAEPLQDAVANTDADEFIDFDITGGTPGAPVTVSVDGGALIIDQATMPQLRLSDAKATVSTSLNNLGAKELRIIGTKTGPVTVTVTSGGITKTAQVTIKADANPVARNIALEGPESAVSGDTVTFVATIQDAFGNPIPNFNSNGGLSIQVAGPARLQGTDTRSDANGEIKINVALDSDADAPVTVSVLGIGGEFGANANDSDANASNGLNRPGLTASVDQASASVDVTDLEGLEQAVAEAEAELAAAEADLAAAQANLDVAQAQLAVAQANVDTLKAKKQSLRQKLNKAKANGNRQKAKTTRNKLRNVKRNLRAAKDAVVIAQTRVDGEQTVVDLRQGQVDKAEEALAQAQADLEEAQN